MDNTTTKLMHVFTTAFAVSPEQITIDLHYQGIPEWDSMSHMILMTELEAAYSIAIETNDVLDMTNVIKIIEVLKKYGIEASL